MGESALGRLWNAIKPPPSVHDPNAPPKGLNRTQKLLIWGAVGVIAVGVTGWQVYAYIASGQQRAQKLFEQGMVKMTPGHYQEAIDLFSQAVDTYPQLGAAYLERGNAENIAGQKEAAFADYEKAIEISNLAPAFTARGLIYLGKGDLKHAEEDFTSSIGVNPNSDAYYQLGQILDNRGEHAKAIEYYDQAIHILPDAPYMYRARGQAKKALGDEAGAIADRNEGVSLERRVRRR
jgi:tetratricopeptide (TPR) repeat protein